MKVTDIKPEDGKKLPVAWTKTLQKLIAAGYLKDEYPDTKTIRQNPFSGAKAEVSALTAALGDWITMPNPINGKLTRSDWDNARYTYNVCWSNAYYILID